MFDKVAARLKKAVIEATLYVLDTTIRVLLILAALYASVTYFHDDQAQTNTPRDAETACFIHGGVEFLTYKAAGEGSDEHLYVQCKDNTVFKSLRTDPSTPSD